jgi:hypothetical protein
MEISHQLSEKIRMLWIVAAHPEIILRTYDWDKNVKNVKEIKGKYHCKNNFRRIFPVNEVNCDANQSGYQVIGKITHVHELTQPQLRVPCSKFHTRLAVEKVLFRSCDVGIQIVRKNNIFNMYGLGIIEIQKKKRVDIPKKQNEFVRMVLAQIQKNTHTENR